jgi:hypothetical protein
MNRLPPSGGPLLNPRAGSPEAQTKLDERLTALVGVLTQERAALEKLLFTLNQCAMLSRAQEHRFVAMASDEVLDVEDDLGLIETARAMLVDDITELAGLPVDVPLTTIIGIAAGPTAAALRSLHAELVRLTSEVATMIQLQGKAISARLEGITGALKRAHSGFGEAYDRWGDAAAKAVAPARFDAQA